MGLLFLPSGWLVGFFVFSQHHHLRVYRIVDPLTRILHNRAVDQRNLATIKEVCKAVDT